MWENLKLYEIWTGINVHLNINRIKTYVGYVVVCMCFRVCTVLLHFILYL